MKYCLLLLVALLHFGAASSQIVVFPDSLFKNKLLESSPANTIAKNLQGDYFAIDVNGDGEIQVTEALQVSALDFSSNYYYRITSIVGIQDFDNLVFIDCSNNDWLPEIMLTDFEFLAEVDVAPCARLQKLIITDNPLLTLIHFGGDGVGAVLNELDTLDCSRNNLSILDLLSNGLVPVAPPLKYLDFSDNHISSFLFSGVTGLRYLDLSGNDFTNIGIHNYFDLEELIFDDNPLVTLDLHYNGLDTIVIGNFPDLTTIDVSGSAFYSLSRAKDLQLFNLPSLTTLNCSENDFTHLILADLPALSSFNIEGLECALTLRNLPAITSLDFADFTLITSLTMDGLDNLTVIDIESAHNIDMSLLSLNDMEHLAFADMLFYADTFAISNMPALDTLLLRNRRLTPQLVFNDLPELKYLQIIARTHDSTFHLSNLPKLDVLRMYDAGINALQLTALPALSDVVIDYASELRSLVLSNLPDLRRLEIVDTRHIENLVLTDLPLQVFKYYFRQGLTEFFERGLSFGNLPQLDSVYVQGLGIESLEFSNLPLLHEIHLEGLHRVHPLTFSELPELKRLDLNSCWLDTLIISGLPKLEDVVVNRTNWEANGWNTLGYFEMTDLPDLKYLSLKENAVPVELQFGITGLPDLHTFYYKQSVDQLTLADVPSLTNLRLETYSFNDSLQFSGFPSLKSFYCYMSGSSCRLMRLRDMPLLEQVNFKFGEADIDLSGCPSLDVLDLQNYYPIDFVNLKNSNPSLSSFYSQEPIASICVDSEAEADLLKSLNPLLAGTVFTSDCPTQPCLFNRISGTLHYDLNNDDCQISPVACANTKVTISGYNTYEVFTDSAGSFEFLSQLLNDDIVITPVFEDPWFTAWPPIATVSFDSFGNTLSIPFCVGAEDEHQDMEVLLSSPDQPRPGLDVTYLVDFKNRGTAAVDGTLNLYYDDEVMELVTADPPYDSHVADCFSWNYTGLNPLEMQHIRITFHLNSPTEVPPLNNGNRLEFRAEILPVVGDENPEDNSFLLRQVVVNSFDPNDKNCMEGPSINLDKVGEYVHYLIRFENTGTAAALNIMVRDVIDTTKLDIHTLVLLGSSHAGVCRITDGNNMQFDFNNINLSHLPGENSGYIHFKIRTVSSLELNDLFQNRAIIYFDYNAPVYTDDCETVVLLNVGTNDPSIPDSGVRLFPNPVNGMLNISSVEPVMRVDIMDVNGRLVRSCSGAGPVDLHALVNGVYLIKVQLKMKSVAFKVIKI